MVEEDLKLTVHVCPRVYLHVYWYKVLSSCCFVDACSGVDISGALVYTDISARSDCSDSPHHPFVITVQFRERPEISVLKAMEVWTWLAFHLYNYPPSSTNPYLLLTMSSGSPSIIVCQLNSPTSMSVVDYTVIVLIHIP